MADGESFLERRGGCREEPFCERGWRVADGIDPADDARSASFSEALITSHQRDAGRNGEWLRHQRLVQVGNLLSG